MRGKVFEACEAAPKHRDHPRACGEKPVAPYRKLKEGGITPAHAGKRFGMHSAKGVNGDHPRACGEKMPSCATRSSWKGSPPRMRGKVDQLLLNAVRVGITPAHAGKSVRRATDRKADLDHPRACGEKTQEVVKYKAYDILHA